MSLSSAMTYHGPARATGMPLSANRALQAHSISRDEQYEWTLLAGRAGPVVGAAVSPKAKVEH